MKIKTIVMLHDEARITGGSAKIAIESAIELKRQGVDVIFFCGVGEPCRELIEAGIRTISLNEEHLGRAKQLKTLFKCLWNLRSYRELRKLLKNLDSESTVVHIHGWTKSLSSSVFLASYLEGFKTIVTGHDYFSICQNGGLYNYKTEKNCSLKPGGIRCYLCNCDKRNYINKLYRNVRHIIQRIIFTITKPCFLFVSSFSRNLLEPHLNPAHKKYCLCNFVDMSIRDRVPVENNAYYLFIGRVSDEKGIDLFCEAIHNASVPAFVIGDGAKKNLYEKLYPSIHFVGWKNKSEMAEYLERARALIITSKLHETMGLTAIEMQPFGIPCIIPRECAASEFIENDHTGLLYSGKEELYNALHRFRDDDYVKKLSICFYTALDLNMYSLTNYAEELKKIYNNMLSE